MLDVVVLPCVPVTAIVGLHARQLAEQVGAVELALAATRRSGFSGGMALETTTSAPGGTSRAVVAPRSAPPPAPATGPGMASRASGRSR